MRTNDVIERMPSMAVFVRVVELGGFSAAARSLGQTPSAVSRQIARLEVDLGVRLLIRTTRKVQLSEVGRSVFHACNEMLAAAMSATDVVGTFMRQPHGLVRVSAPMTFGKILISPLLPAFLNRYADVDVQLMLTDRHVDLIDDDVDLVIRIEPDPPPGLIAMPLAQVNYVLCASTGYLAQAGAPLVPQELGTHSCLFFGDNVGDNRWNLVRGQCKVVVNVRGRLIVNHSEAMLDAIKNGAGIGFLPYFTARDALVQNDVTQLFPDWELISPYRGTAWLLSLPNRHLPPKVRIFIDYLKERVPLV